MLKSNKEGFTLIEVILMISLFSIIFMAISFNFKNIKLIKQNSEINTLINDLELYRNKALIEKTNIEFRVYNDKKSYSFTEYRIELLKRQLESDYEITYNMPSPYIVFRSTGAVSTGGTLTLRNKKSYVKIIIQPVTGNIRIEKMDD